MNLKTRKTALATIMLTIAIALIFIAMPSEVNATVTGVDKVFGIEKLPGDLTPNWGYAIGDPDDNATRASSTIIWNIREYQSTSGSVNSDSSKNIYCVKAGVGFGGATIAESTRRKEYTQAYDMKADIKSLRDDTNSNQKLSTIINGTVPYNSGTVNRYDALLALADRLYLLGREDNAVARKAWLRERGALLEDVSDEAILTEGDIAATQQAAIWYFTNYHDEDNEKYDKTDPQNTSWIHYTTDGDSYEDLGDYDRQYGKVGAGEARRQYIKILYDNLIEEAKANASKYTKYREASIAGTTVSELDAPASLTSTTLGWEQSEDGANYVLGPIVITKNPDNATPYNITLTVKPNGQGDGIGYTVLNSDKIPTSNSIKELVENEESFYVSVPKSNGKKYTIETTVSFSNSTLTLYTKNDADIQPVMIPEQTTPQDVQQTPLTVEIPEVFDLRLIKAITEVNGEPIPGRITTSIDANTKEIKYDVSKKAYGVKKGDIVTYTLRVYNEGEVDGYASQITETIPEGLQYLYTSDLNYENYTQDEKNAAEFNLTNLWGVPSQSGTDTIVSTNALSKNTSDSNLIKAYDPNSPYSDQDPKNPDYKEVQIKLKVIAESKSGKVIRNEAAITGHTDKDGLTPDGFIDIDSQPENWPGKEPGHNYQDDEDYDNIQLETFDLALRKFIIAVSPDEEISSSEYLRNTNGKYTREPIVDTSKLNTEDLAGNVITTAEYNHPKTPVEVEKGDIVVYMLRVYNEGSLDGYAAEITDHLPPYLELINNEYNKARGWVPSGTDGRTVTTTKLNNELIEAVSTDANGKYVLNYKQIEIMCKVASTDDVPMDKNITNIAEITKYEDAEHTVMNDQDRDSEPVAPGNVVLPADSLLPDYKGDETGSYIPGQQDDDDFEKVVITEKNFDLALRKFIVAVSHDEEISSEEYLTNEDGSYTREPVVDTSKLNTLDENGKLITTAEYNHTKEPVTVQRNDIVVYMLRVYNEGDRDGYAAQIKDCLPPHLEFIDNDYNKQYGWKVSKENERIVTTSYLENSLIKKAEKVENGYKLDYKEVPIMCRVTESAPRNENITNIADITIYQDAKHDPVTDRDSQQDNVNLPADKDLPGYKDNETGSYVPGQQDDDDFEKVVVKKFDLALKKWVTQAIVTDKKGTTVTNTGHQPYDEPEQIVKVEVHRKKINEVTVKFKYSIRVINEGDIEGYAKEVKDYVPEGLKFVAADNPGWTDEGNNVISTRLLEDTLLKPGEYADIEVVLTWINGSNNMGLKTNIAEISEDYNEYGVPDEDSTPNNKVDGEDDMNDAPVLLAVSTGQMRIYFTLGFTILITLAAGIVTIRKYVL